MEVIGSIVPVESLEPVCCWNRRTAERLLVYSPHWDVGAEFQVAESGIIYNGADAISEEKQNKASRQCLFLLDLVICVDEGRWRSCCGKSLPVSINSPWEYPHRSTQRYVSPLIPEPMKLWRLSITDTNLSLAETSAFSVFAFTGTLLHLKDGRNVTPLPYSPRVDA